MFWTEGLLEQHALRWDLQSPWVVFVLWKAKAAPKNPNMATLSPLRANDCRAVEFYLSTQCLHCSLTLNVTISSLLWLLVRVLLRRFIWSPFPVETALHYVFLIRYRWLRNLCRFLSLYAKPVPFFIFCREPHQNYWRICKIRTRVVKSTPLAPPVLHM